MKKNTLMKSMAALTLTLAAAGCSHDADLYDQAAKQRESANNFVNLVLGGQQVDPNQNWSTATTRTLTVSSEIAEGTLKVYTVDPIGNVSAPLITTTLSKGDTKSINVACPNDVQRLYVAVYDAQNYLRVQPVDVTGSQLNVSFDKEEPAAESRARRAPGNYWKNSHQFASAPNDADFATSVPGGALPEDNCNGGGQGVNVVISHATVGYLNLWNAGSNVYFPAGNWTVNGQYVGANSKVYLLPGANVTFSGEYNLNSENAALYVAKGATFTADNISYNFKLYNRGTINTGNLNQYANGWIYNEGTINCSGEIGPKNNFSEIVNVGTMTAAKMTVEGSGHVLNEGTVRISGDVVVNSNNLSWVNNGYFHCGNFKYEAGSWNVINNCKLVVDEQFYINLGDSQGEFKLDGSVETKTFYHGIGYTKMTGKSIIKVAETLTCAAMADGRYYGFYGPESADNGYAVIQAKKITATNLTQRRSITYRNYLIVATDYHWEQCDKYNNQVNGNYPYWDQGDNVKIAKGKDDIDVTIEPTDCNAGINGKEVIVIDEPTQYYYYAFEDLGTTDDFDFNDVVIRLSAPVNGQSTVEIVAAGGTMETYVTYGEGEHPTRLGSEVHAAMGENSTKTMINTSGVNTDKFAVLGTVPVAADADPTNLPFGIEVKGNDGQTVKVTRSVENNGSAPLVIVVNGNEQGKWFWATERTNIVAAYQAFGDWGANAGTNADWYKTATPGMVVNY
jgi:hypothetical protein